MPYGTKFCSSCGTPASSLEEQAHHTPKLAKRWMGVFLVLAGTALLALFIADVLDRQLGTLAVMIGVVAGVLITGLGKWVTDKQQGVDWPKVQGFL